MERHPLLVKQAEYERSMLAGFRGMLADGALVDVSLGVEGRLVGAHKIVLAMISPYFKRMFETVPHPHPIIILKDVTMRHFKQILNYVYRGEVSLPSNDMHDFLRTGKLLEIRGLKDIDIGDCSRQQDRPDVNVSVRRENQENRPSSYGEHARSKRPCASEDRLQVLGSAYEPDRGPAEKRTRIISDGPSSRSRSPSDPVSPLITVPKEEPPEDDLSDFFSQEEEELGMRGYSEPHASTSRDTNAADPRRVPTEGSSSLLTAPSGSRVGGCCCQQAKRATFNKSTETVSKKSECIDSKVLVVKLVDIFKNK